MKEFLKESYDPNKGNKLCFKAKRPPRVGDGDRHPDTHGENNLLHREKGFFIEKNKLERRLLLITEL